MKRKYFLKKISNYAIVGGVGALLISGIIGCEDKNNNGQNGNNQAFTNASQKQNAFVIIEKTPDGRYTIVDEYPSSKTTIVLREGQKERILSKVEIDALVAQEAVKIDNGTSNLTNPNQSSLSGGSMGGLGEVLLSSIAGAMIGSYIGNKLFNNNNYQNQRRTNYKSPSTFSRSKNSFNKAKSSGYRKTTTTKRSGFFGSRSRSSSSSRSFFGG